MENIDSQIASLQSQKDACMQEFAQTQAIFDHRTTLLQKTLEQHPLTPSRTALPDNATMTQISQTVQTLPNLIECLTKNPHELPPGSGPSILDALQSFVSCSGFMVSLTGLTTPTAIYPPSEPILPAPTMQLHHGSTLSHPLLANQSTTADLTSAQPHDSCDTTQTTQTLAAEPQYPADWQQDNDDTILTQPLNLGAIAIQRLNTEKGARAADYRLSPY